MKFQKITILVLTLLKKLKIKFHLLRSRLPEFKKIFKPIFLERHFGIINILKYMIKKLRNKKRIKN